MEKYSFEWDDKKDLSNHEKHGVCFYEAQKAFFDEKRIIAEDIEHSYLEKSFVHDKKYCWYKKFF